MAAGVCVLIAAHPTLTQRLRTDQQTHVTNYEPSTNNILLLHSMAEHPSRAAPIAAPSPPHSPAACRAYRGRRLEPNTGTASAEADL